MSTCGCSASCGEDYIVGDKPRLTAEFRLGKIFTDPIAVTFKYRAPGDLVSTVWVYGVDSEVVRDSAGKYHVDLPLTAAGLWLFGWYGVGVVDAVEEGEFPVAASRL